MSTSDDTFEKAFEPSAGDSRFEEEQKKRLRDAITELRKEPDWSGFKDYLEAQMGGNMDKLTPYILSDLREKYHIERSMNRLADKIADEYDRFIKDMKQQPAERIIEAAYEIVQKDDIREYCSGADHMLSQEELDDLFACEDLLDRLYNKWDELTETHSLYDMDLMLEETASDLKDERLEREKAESEPDMDKPGIPRSVKHKWR